MTSYFNPAFFGFLLLFIVFFYTVHLVRSGRLSAHLAVAWIATELLLAVVMGVGFVRSFTKSILGDEGAPYSLFLFGILWIVFLMLESLVRISSLTIKMKNLSQENALLKERMDRVESSSINKAVES